MPVGQSTVSCGFGREGATVEDACVQFVHGLDEGVQVRVVSGWDLEYNSEVRFYRMKRVKNKFN